MIKEGENTKFSHLKFPSPFFLFFFLSFFLWTFDAFVVKHPTFNHRSFVKQTRRRTLQRRRRRMRTKRRREREDTKDAEIVLSHDVDDDDDDDENENENDGVTRGRGF